MINLSDYYNIRFEGADGYGRVNYEFDKKKFMDKNKEKIRSTYDDPSVRTNPVALADSVSEFISYNTEVITDPEENLSNGEEVTVDFTIESYEIENYYKVKINSDSKKVKVEGLKEVKTADPSEFFDFEVEGISPNANLNIIRKEDVPDYLDYVQVNADKTSGLRLGDEVEVNFTFQEDTLINDYGVVIEPKSIKIPIDGVASYISSYDELSDEDKSEIEEEAGYQVDDEVKSWTLSDLTKKDLIGTITISPKSEDSYWGSANNRVILVYDMTCTENIPEENYKYDFSYFTYVEFSDVLNSSDDDLYKSVDISGKSLSHRAQMEDGDTKTIYFKGYYFMDQLMDKLYSHYSEDNYNYEISFNLDDYRIKSDGLAGDYQSDKGPRLRLTEDGKAYYIQYEKEALEGSWEEDGKNFKLSLKGINKGKALEGVITDSKKLRIPDQGGWSGEAFVKMY